MSVEPHIHRIAYRGEEDRPHLQVCYNPKCLSDPKHQVQTLAEFERENP